MTISLYTIGFTKKTAEQFFAALRRAEVRSLLDIRLNNVSQLAGFTKRDDLKYFLREICHAEYIHVPQCAPTKEILDAYQKNGGDWVAYVDRFIPLISERRIETLLIPDLLDHGFGDNYGPFHRVKHLRDWLPSNIMDGFLISPLVQRLSA